MNSAIEILNYASTHNINISVDGEHIKLEAIDGEISDNFIESAKQHKPELITALTERWNPELAADGYVWCIDCRHWSGTACTYPDNPFRKQCVHVPRKCQWYEED